MKIKVILKPGMTDIEERVARAFQEALEHHADFIEISYGSKASETKKRLLNFLMKDEYRKVYSRLAKSKEGWGRIFVYFRWT